MQTETELPKVKEIDNLKIEQKITRATNNYKELCKLASDGTNLKLNKFLDWIVRQSELLLREQKYPRRYFAVYKRGTIIKVNFGTNIGHEFSNIHYALVLNKKDVRTNGVLTVIPLTSKNKENNLNIGNGLFDEFVKSILNKINNIDENHAEEIKKLKLVLSHYSKSPLNSFACYQNITTISKTRIINPINEFDLINKMTCSDEIMQIIDEKILDFYTNL